MLDEACSVTYTLPWSVVGGARMSGFCKSMYLLSGPNIDAPREPRIGSVSVSNGSVIFQVGLLGSVLAKGTVAVD